MICGIDEAGRGPVIGPLVIAGFKCREVAINDLEEMGVKDSKRLSPARREGLYDDLTNTYDYTVIIVEPKELDSYLSRGVSLNRLEGEKFGEVINRLRPRQAFIDCADVKPANFRGHIMSVMEEPCEMIIRHKADDIYPVVSAASIIAKVVRDSEIEKLWDEYGDLGSGYTSDKKTQAFLEDWYRSHKDLPECARRSWRLKLFKNKRLDSSTMDGFL